ncbi:MAG: septum formation initiator family protein [Ahrensia sp.]|nr:septum formation initiator family protein [Ahrensia sp.]
MKFRSRKRHPLSRFIAPVMTLTILGYFGYHAMNGHYGVRAQVAMEKRLADLEQELAARTAIRKKLEARVMMVRDGSMDRDMIDEQIRRKLNMTRSDEIVLFQTR